MGNKEIGLNSSGDSGDDFRIGTMTMDFQSDGKIRWMIDALIIWVRGAATIEAADVKRQHLH